MQVALKALFQARRAGDLSVCVQFKTDEFAGWMSVENRRVRIGLGEAETPDVIVGSTIKELFSQADVGQLCLSGSTEKLKRFKSAFVLPG